MEFPNSPSSDNTITSAVSVRENVESSTLDTNPRIEFFPPRHTTSHPSEDHLGNMSRASSELARIIGVPEASAKVALDYIDREMERLLGEQM